MQPVQPQGRPERYARIVGTGTAVPERVMKNAEFEAFLDTSDEWIRTRTGIEERRIADVAKGETTTELAYQAALKACEAADIPPSEIELILVGTITPDAIMPCTANFLQQRLGAKRAFGFDLQAACAGWLFGLGTAESFIRNGTVKNALVVGVELLSTAMNWRDRGTCVLFGDGAGATVLRASESRDHAVLKTRLFNDGSGVEMLKIPHGASKVPPHHPDFTGAGRSIQMQGAEIFKHAVRNMQEAATIVLAEEGMAPSDVDYFIFHQANLRIIDACKKALGVPDEKTWVNVQRFGNVSSATLPIALDEAWRAGKVGPGKTVLFATFGGGLAWGASLVRL